MSPRSDTISTRRPPTRAATPPIAASPIAAATSPSDLPEASDLLPELLRLRDALLAAEARVPLSAVHPLHAGSAKNLVHYLALRDRDLRELQTRLAELGLSSLGRSEPHVLATVDAVATAVAALSGEDAAAVPPPRVEADLPDFRSGPRRLEANADSVLGPRAKTRQTRIMVTLPSEAATDPDLVLSLVDRGMDLARINCAHDGPAEWGAMAAHVRSACETRGRTCRILVDLAGPKLRTGPLAPGPAVVRVRPSRDDLGRVTRNAVVALVPGDVAGDRIGADEGGRFVVVPVSSKHGLPPAGSELTLRDARGARRSLHVVREDGRVAYAETDQTAYLVPGTRLRARTGRWRGRIGAIPPAEGFVVLHAGDPLVLDDVAEARPADDGLVHVGCTLPEAVHALRPGQPAWFDDGKIGAVVERVAGRQALLRVTQARPGGTRLRGEKGINLPETEIDVPAMTAKDHEDLAAVIGFADLVGLSFVSRPSDVADLLLALDHLGAGRLGVVLKIETRRAFEALPGLLLAGMRSERLAVMIARGDLAVESGFERLAEVQEEILWLCEAAHVPTIWATQVLDSLARSGLPSRSEITDAAMAARAECVMLNKGPFIEQAITTLDDVLRRMEGHQHKKRPLLRRLRAWS